MNVTNEASKAGHAAQREAGPWIERTARIGYAAKGIVYVIVGWLAAQTAFGTGGQTTDSRGALRVLAQQPFGTALLWIVAIGLAGYAVWRFVQAATNPENREGFKRVLDVIKGVAHLLLAYSAAKLAMGESSGDGGSGFLSSVANNSLGRWIIIAVGIGLLCYGVYQVVKAVKSDVAEHLSLGSMSAGARDAVIQIARFGIASRGVVFAILGFLFSRAAWRRAGEGQQDTDAALDLLAGLPGGTVILALVALGLVAYGIYCFVSARYRRFAAV